MVTFATPRARAELVLFCITFIWGSTFVVTKELLSSISPFAYIGLRFSLAAVLFVAIFPRSVSTLTKAAALHGAVLGGLLFAGFVLQTVGLQYTTASKSAFITGMLVVFTLLWQVALERRFPRLGTVLGVGLVTVGLYLLTLPAGSGFNVGDAMTLGCAFLFGLYIVMLDIYGKRSDATHLTILQFLVSAVGGGLAAMFLEDVVVEWSAPMALRLAYLAVFATVIALYLQTKYQKDTTPARSAVIFSLEPVVAAVLAYVVAGERIGVVGAIGGGLIVAGLLLSELSDQLFGDRNEAAHSG
ncbi:MAG: DMT family transporter [Bacteroidota bacterium]